MRFNFAIVIALVALLSAVVAAYPRLRTRSGLLASPVIGIFAQPRDPKLQYEQYIAASYVKWVESAGGRVVPIPYQASIEHLTVLMESIDGFLLPGGGSAIPSSVKAAVSMGVALNTKGRYFPMWGTCMGFQWMSMIFGENDGILKPLRQQNISLPLDFTAEAPYSRLFGHLPINDMLVYSDRNLNVTLNNHNYGVSTGDFDKYLSKSFNLLSTNVDERGSLFVSSMEHKDLPVYAVQWHPEKNNFETSRDADGSWHEAINHSTEAVLASQWMANFFINEARKSTNGFATVEEERDELIYNYNPTYFPGGGFVQRYLFKVNPATGRFIKP